MTDSVPEWLAPKLVSRDVVATFPHRPDLPHLVCAFVTYPLDAPPEGKLVGRGYGMNYVLRGRGVYHEPHGTEYPLAPGTVYQRCGKYPHVARWDRNEPVAECYVSVGRLTFAHLEAVGLLDMTPPAWPVGLSKRIVEYYDRLFEMTRHCDEADAPRLLMQVLELAAELRAAQPAPQQPAAHIDEVETVRRWMEQNPADRRPMREVADLVGLSYATLRKAFPAATGMSLSTYRLRCRVGHARRMLETRSVAEVAESLGYPDAFTFSKQFRQVEGLSPKQFQRHYYRQG